MRMHETERVNETEETMDKKYVVGVYRTEQEAVSAIRRLHEMGYTSDDISVISKDPERFGFIENQTDVVMESPKAVARSAGAGAAAGGLLGGIGGLLIGLGALVIPGVGPFLAAGPIVGAIGGLAAGGTVGGALGALVGLGIDKEEARDYEAALERGELLVIVHAPGDRYDQTYDIFRYPEEEYYRHYKRMGINNYPHDPVLDPMDVNRDHRTNT